MGFFSGVRRRIKKLIPKEIRPFIPYAAAFLPGGMGLSGNLLKFGGDKFLKSAIARGLTDDEASIKDIARTGILAAAPTAIGEGLQLGSVNAELAGKMKTADYLSRGADYVKDMGALKTIGGQGAIDYGIKAAELNEDALAEYNRMMAEQGIADKAGRRSAIRKIYENTGTWDMDEVDSMLDTYGYRTGGRVGYAEGDMVLTDPSMVTPEQRNQIEGNQMAEQAYNEIFTKFMERFPGLATGEETLEEMIAMLQAENVMETENLGILGLDRSMDMITPESVRDNTRRIMMGDTQYGEVPGMMYGGMASKRGLVDGPGGYAGKKKDKKKFDESDFYNSFKYAKEGLESLEEAEDEIKPLPIRELRLARGGITDIEVEEQIDTPSGDMMMDENIKMASDPSPMDELDSLSLMLFKKPLSELTDDEYEDLKDFASQQALKPGLIDEYRNYKYDMEEQGRTPMAPRDYFRMEFGAARMGVAKGGPIELNINVGGNKMEDIKGQTAGPQWYQDRIDALMFEFGDELTDEEIADIAFDSDKFYDKMGYDPGDFGGYKKGGKVIELMPKGILYKGKAKDYPGIKQLIKDMKKKGTRPKKADGGLMNLGGNEMDLRGGGFVPMGAKERADDVPARLSKNEFVMTADAVRGAGGGSVQKGADLMYDQMKRLEGQA